MNIPVMVIWDNKLFRYMVEMSDSAMVAPDCSWNCFARLNPDFPDETEMTQFVHQWTNLEELGNDFDYTLDCPYPESPEGTRTNRIYKTYSPDETDQSRPWMPQEMLSRELTLKFPLHSIETYTDTDYVLKISTWVSNTEIVLGSYLIDKNMRLAQKPEMMIEERYYEFVKFRIPDPWSIIYGDEWQQWRHMICGEPEVEHLDPETGTSGEFHFLNNTVSSLIVSIYPVVKNEGMYHGTSDSNIGSTAVTLAKDNGFMTPVLRFKNNSSDLEIELEYNEIYSNLEEYFLETYYIDIQNLIIKYILTVQDADDIYNMIESEEIPSETPTEDAHRRYVQECPRNLLEISDWSEFWAGQFLRGLIEIWDGDNLILSVTTNDIVLTPDVYRYLIQSDIDGIELNSVRMYNYNLYVANKINKKVVQVDTPNESKTKIMKPVFFQANKLDNTVIYPETTSNVCINLNSYKSKVDFFYLKIEGVSFPEIGRTHQGVIFKIQGNLLPRAVEEGKMYVLDQDKELVVSGSFKYVS